MTEYIYSFVNYRYLKYSLLVIIVMIKVLAFQLTGFCWPISTILNSSNVRLVLMLMLMIAIVLLICENQLALMRFRESRLEH